MNESQTRTNVGLHKTPFEHLTATPLAAKATRLNDFRNFISPEII
jgi:hypothetical protein